jgi:uncharacterized membrane protein YgdD (TMEM256/DUF423 family)
MAKGQLLHRHELERDEQAHLQHAFDRTMKLQSFGQVSAFIIVGAVLVAGLYLIATGRSTQGLVALLTPLGGVATVILLKK